MFLFPLYTFFCLLLLSVTSFYLLLPSATFCYFYKYFPTACFPNCKTLDPLLTVVTEIPISLAISRCVCQDFNFLRSCNLSQSSTISWGVMISSSTALISLVLIEEKKFATDDKCSVKYLEVKSEKLKVRS